uniref:ABC transmembrane type-1 domain-containing protein n=2 Tax=Parascaris univalens TaxID=6257 RepID=A0A914ZNB2_PARUN
NALLRQRSLSRSSGKSPSKHQLSHDSLTESVISLAKATKVDRLIGGAGDEEERAEGAVTWAVYGHYLRALAQPAVMLPFLVTFAAAVQVFNNFIDWWLNKWTNAAERATNRSSSNSIVGNEYANITQPSEIYVDHARLGSMMLDLDLSDYQIVFTVMVLLLMIVSVARSVWFRLVQVSAARLLHDMMFTAVVKAKVIFFDTNPIGRILNRFSKDVGTMDDQLSFAFFDFFTGTLNFLGIVAVTLLINPAVFIPTLPLAFVFFFVRIFYLSSSRDVKRLEATTRSPLYSHISASMQGLTTVRAFSNESRTLKEYHNRQDVNTSAFFLSLATARWFASSIDWLVAFFITGVAFASVLSPALSASAVGLSLMYAIAMAGTFGRYLEIWTRCEINMVSVERIMNYSELPSEPLTEGILPPSDWPTMGHLQFRNVSLRYDEDGDFVLKDIDADIQPKEKIGIVGRTGAGKSSLLRALFRLTEPDGSVLIDGLDTKKVVLQELRKRLSIIPQDPVLFIGSLRRNLDPFAEFSDDDLWSALEQVELKTAVSDLSSGLETHMQEGGANFSVGQRQLICLARALLRNARIIVIDEATANVDPETDALIQRTIKARFISSTVLTIAHRLNTIMDSDRVMVLENGRLIEFDHPHILLQREDGVFASLVAETGAQNSALLRRLAEACYQKRIKRNSE